jgi:hypothetical protein
MHIASVFIIVIVSLIGSVGPVLVNMWAERRKNETASKNSGFNTQTYNFAVRFGVLFGAGTMLSTGLVHMLVPSSETLTSECLPELWNTEYRSFAPVFAIAAILLMQLMQHLLVCAYTKHTGEDTTMLESNDDRINIPGCSHTHHLNNNNFRDSSKTSVEGNLVSESKAEAAAAEKDKLSRRIAVVMLEVGIGKFYLQKNMYYLIHFIHP